MYFLIQKSYVESSEAVNEIMTICSTTDLFIYFAQDTDKQANSVAFKLKPFK